MQNMDFKSFIYGVITAAMIAGLTSLLSHVSQTSQLNIRFNHNYQKMVIENRFEAIEEVYALLNGFRTTVQSSNKKTSHLIFHVSAMRHDYVGKIIALGRHERWLSSSVRAYLANLQRFLLDNSVDLGSKEHGQLYFDELSILVHDLDLQLSEEIRAMANQERFYSFLEK